MAGKDPWGVTRLLIGVRGGALDSILIDDSTASMDRPRDHDARRCALKLRERGRNAGPRRYVRAETVSAGRRREKGRLQRAGTLGAALRRCSRGSRVAQERPAPLWTSHLGACRRPVPARDHPRSGTTGGQVISALPTRGPRSATVSVPAQIRSSHHCSR